MELEEFKAMQAKALEQFRTGQSLTGKVGAFAIYERPELCLSGSQKNAGRT